MSKKKRKGKGRVPTARRPPAVTRLESGETMVSTGPAASQLEPPAPPVGTSAAPLLIDGVGPTLVVPTLALMQLVSLARKEHLPLTLPEDVERRIDSSGQHQLTELVRVTGEGTTDFVRCRTRMLMQGAGALRPYEAWLDFPSRYVGMLLNSAEKMERVADAPEEVGDIWRDTFRFAVNKPTWAGSFSFDRCWNHAATVLRQPTTAERIDGEWNVDPETLFKVESLLHLHDAHLIRVEPDQVQVLPDWEDVSDLFAYALDAALPFPTCYLDFEGPGGVAPRHSVKVRIHENDDVTETTDLLVNLKGAVVRRERSEDPTGAEVGDLLVVPYGEVQQGDKVTGGYEPLGAFMFGATPTNALSQMEMRTYPRDGSAPIRSVIPGVAASVLAYGATEAVDGIPGIATLPLDAIQFGDDLGLSSLDLNKQLVAWGSVVFSCASRVLAALSVMETEAIVIGDAPMENRDRKRAEKRGWQIAQMVYVRPTRKGPRREPTGEEREYSHRFWVSAHYKHFPLGTRMADARPDLVKPCTRIGDASCGRCRRVYTPPFIKGPEDKPLVPKTLVKRRHPELEAVV